MIADIIKQPPRRVARRRVERIVYCNPRSKLKVPRGESIACHLAFLSFDTPVVSALLLLPPSFIYASRQLGLSCFLEIANQQQLPPTLHLQQSHPIRPTNQCPVSRTRLLASDSEQLSKTQTKKAHDAVDRVQILSLVSHQSRPLLSTRHDPAQAKARDRSPQRSFTATTKTMAIVSSHHATQVTCGRPTISWRRAGHPLHPDTGPCPLNRMLPKVSVLLISHSPPRTSGVGPAFIYPHIFRISQFSPCFLASKPP